MKIRIAFFVIIFLYLFSYLIAIKLGLSQWVQEIRYLIVVLHAVILLSLLRIVKVQLKSVDYYTVVTVVLFYLISTLRYPLSFTSNLKMMVYVGSFVLFYSMHYSSDLNLFKYQDFLSIVILVVCFNQLFTSDLEFINGVYRLSGPYYKHSSGFALFLCIWLGTYVGRRPSTFIVIIIMSLSYFLIRTGSRSALLGCFLGALYLGNRKIHGIRKLIVFIVIGLMLIVLGKAILELDAMYRMRYFFEHGEDGSTLSRLTFARALLAQEGWSYFQLRGGYTPFLLEGIFGKRIGSHNNLLLFYIEGGLFGLGLYVLHLSAVFRRIIKLGNDQLIFMFISFYVGGILSNNFYYVLPMSIFWGYYGMALKRGYE